MPTQSSAVLERTRPVFNQTRMNHRAYRATPTVALCGARLRGVHYPDGTPLDCHVCAELFEDLRKRNAA